MSPGNADLPTLGPVPLRRNGSGWPSIHGYEILAVVGSGAMGIVYKARHRDLHRTVALKTLHGFALDDPEFRVRFQAEAEAVARLQHPHIIQVFEIGTVATRHGEGEARPFIALELVDGGSLELRTQKPQALAYAAGVVEKLARAAHAAHQVGVIHRDLKPANVLLTRSGEPKIADFGLAKLLGGERDPRRRCQTQPGIVLGTPEYMAPEQAEGAPPARSVDVYALGVILYELLTARVPFQGASPAETMALARLQEPVAPSRLQPGVPRDLDTICLKCLEKDPARRYTSAQALADDLQRFLDDRPILARRPSEIEKVGRWCRRNPLATASLAAVIGIFITAFGLVSWSYTRAEHARLQADESRLEETRQREEAQRREKAERWERYRAGIVASASALQVYNVGSARPTLEAAPEEYRNWEWRHLHSQLDLARHVVSFPADQIEFSGATPGGQRLVLFGNGTLRVWDTRDQRVVRQYDNAPELWAARLTPDGRTLVSATPDHTVVLRDVATGDVRAVLRGHEQTVRSLRISRDGALLLTASDDGNIRLWDARTAQPLAARRVPGLLSLLHLHPDGRCVAWGAAGARTVHLLNLQTGAEVATLTGHEQDLLGIDINPQGDRIATVENFPSNTLHLWDAETGRLLEVLRGHTNAVAKLVFSDDGRYLATASRDQTVRLWDGGTGRPIATLRGHRGWVNDLSFSPDGKRVATASQDRTVRLWDAATGELLAVLHGHTGNVVTVACTADGALVSAAQDGTIRIWDAAAVERNGILRGHTTFVYGVAFHPDGRHVASASWDGTARVWDTTTGRHTTLNHGDKAIVTSVAFHPSGKLLASRSRDAVRLWDVAAGREVHRWDVPSDWWRDTRLAFSKRGDRLAAGCRNREIRIWDVASRAEVAVLRGHQDEIRDVAFSPDGTLLASAADQGDRLIRIWDVAKQEQIRALEGHTAGGYAVAFNADGTLLASGATDGTVRVWDPTTWKEVAVLRHGSNVYGVAFTPDGTRLACASADNAIRFWDVGTHQEVAELRGPESYVHQVAFSPDGTRLVSASGDGTVRVWDTVRPQDRFAGDR